MYPQSVTALTEPNRNRLILLACWLIVYCTFALFAPPLLDDADSVHAEVAREMLVRHDYVTLHANGIRYLEKAPLFYWSMAASFRLFGVSTAASRVPLALGVLLLALLLESFARRAFATPRAGLYAGLITLSSFGIFIFSRINIPDVLVCDWLVLALYAYWRTDSEATPSRHWCWLFAVACALNILTKGLIGIVFPVGIVLAHLLATRGVRAAMRRLAQFHLLSSLVLFLLIAAPWHILAALANPTQGHPGHLTFTHGHFTVPLPTDGNVHGWAWFYFINEPLLRYLNLRVPHDYDTVPLWLFLGLIAVWLLPWSAFLPGAVSRALPWWDINFRKRLRSLRLIRKERTSLLLIIWAFLPLAFFSFSTRQEYYILPSLPPMILLIVRELCRPRQSPRIELAGQWMRSVGFATAVFSIFFLIFAKAPTPNTDLSTLLSQNPEDYAMSFGHFLDLNGRALGMFRICLWLLLVSVPGGALSYLMLRRGKHLHGAVLALAGYSFLFLFASWEALLIFSPALSSAQLAKAIETQLRPDDMIAIHGEYEAGSTLGFYLQRDDIHVVEGRSSNLWYGSFFPDSPPIFESRESLVAKWSGPRRIFLWEDPSDSRRPPLVLPGPVYRIAESGGKRILSNRGQY